MKRWIIVSGGQSGVDRAALATAIELGFAYEGWTPRGGWAEDLTDPPGVLRLFPTLRETDSPDPAVRTLLNVHDSDATLILTTGVRSPGSELAVREAQRLCRPFFIASPYDAVDRARSWLSALKSVHRLNVAGPRESECPGATASARDFLTRLLAPSSATETL